MFNNKQLEFQVMTMQRDLDDMKKIVTEKDKLIAELERDKIVAAKDIEAIKEEMNDLEKRFAKKIVETIVFGAIAMIITTFASGIIGASGIGGIL